MTNIPRYLSHTGGLKMRTPGVEPGSQAWEACMMPLHYVRHCTQMLPARDSAHAARLVVRGMRAFLRIVWIVGVDRGLVVLFRALLTLWRSPRKCLQKKHIQSAPKSEDMTTLILCSIAVYHAGAACRPALQQQCTHVSGGIKTPGCACDVVELWRA